MEQVRRGQIPARGGSAVLDLEGRHPLLGWQLEAEHLGVERELGLERVLDVLGLAEAVLLPAYRR